MAETHKNQRNRNQKMEYWQGHIERWTESTLTAAQYCREHGLTLCQFSYWRGRVPGSQTPLFVEVEATSYQTYVPESDRTITIEMKQGSNITICTQHFEKDLSSILRVLRSHSC